MRSPTAKATVTGSGRKRELHYKVSTSADTAVTFVEQTKHLTHLIGVAKGRSGTITFTPADGPAGRRDIVAELTNDGTPITNPTVATYAAPGPLTPGKATHLRVVASQRAFAYSYVPPANATKVLVTIAASDGRHLERVVSAKSHRGSVPTRGLPDAVTVTVTGIAANGRRGLPVSARVKLAATQPHHRGKSKTA